MEYVMSNIRMKHMGSNVTFWGKKTSKCFEAIPALGQIRPPVTHGSTLSQQVLATASQRSSRLVPLRSSHHHGPRRTH
ncbi:hypothetical protein E2C01_063069 [Portunus trituberculatus]|uniref:Uncharacterized protein n=1 Tax=Portunus trituberculatus TaxID=210409 RepID=A0A5B7HGI6_PORTR|nr:hypothetical protein [Portunus trituberculatus]